MIRLITSVAARVFLGGGFNPKSMIRDLADAYLRLENAEGEVEKAKIQAEIEEMKIRAELQAESSRTFWSPMMVGQYLIVVPFGLWWASIYLVSILNDNLGWGLVVQDVPADIKTMAEWLVPMIVVGTFLERLRK